VSELGWGLKGLIDPGEQIAIDEQLLAQQCGEIGQAPAETGAQLQVLEQEQCNQGGPDLNLQGIGAGADEGFDAEILFERFEEEFDLPALAVDILTAQEAIYLVSQHVGVAIVTEPASVGLSAEGVVIRPLSDPSLSFETCLIMRTDDDSRLANEFGRSFLRRCAPQRMPPKQMEFWLSQPELSS
jgi:DNA-binding transcriptional LysR family regulator